ncbi:hypothetical protein ABIE09_000405 [Lysobacter enzymogenes]|uniref:hypothetical protein n=1 Tax=Lysobacter enzymogenes TaxID=69 RepID=UPI003398B27E
MRLPRGAASHIRLLLRSVFCFGPVSLSVRFPRHPRFSVIPAKAGTHFDFAFAAVIAGARNSENQNGFRLSPE